MLDRRKQLDNRVAEVIRMMQLLSETKDWNLIEYQLAESKRLLTEIHHDFIMLKDEGESENG